MKENQLKQSTKCVTLFILITLITKVRGIVLEAEGETVAFEEGEVESLVLDCPYLLEGDDVAELVVLWEYETFPRPIYQWIPMSDPVVTLHALESRIDLNHTVSEQEHERHRALKLLSPSTDLSGVYRCKVSTFSDEKIYSKKVVMYAPPSEVVLQVEELDDELLRVSCLVGPSFPEPVVSISTSSSGASIPLEDLERNTTWASGRYEMRVEKELRRDDFPSKTEFECRVRLPDTPLERSEFVQFEPTPDETITSTVTSEPDLSQYEMDSDENSESSENSDPDTDDESNAENGPKQQEVKSAAAIFEKSPFVFILFLCSILRNTF